MLIPGIVTRAIVAVGILIEQGDKVIITNAVTAAIATISIIRKLGQVPYFGCCVGGPLNGSVYIMVGIYRMVDIG